MTSPGEHPDSANTTHEATANDWDSDREAALRELFAVSQEFYDLGDEAPGPKWDDLHARIPGLAVTNAGGACPYQAEGTLHGMEFYFRYRSGYAHLRVGREEIVTEHLYSAGEQVGHPLDGSLTRDEFINLMCTLVARLERSTFRYWFNGYKPNVHKDERTGELTVTQTGEPEKYPGWGHTPEEGYTNAVEFRFSPYLAKHGWDEGFQRATHAARAIQPGALNEDTRVFPDPEPVFSVLPA